MTKDPSCHNDFTGFTYIMPLHFLQRLLTEFQCLNAICEKLVNDPQRHLGYAMKQGKFAMNRSADLISKFTREKQRLY